MDQTDTEALGDEVRALLRDRLGSAVDGLPGDADLAQSLGERYDSLTALECVTAIESRFDLEVDFVAHDVRHWFSTIDRITRFVRNEIEDRELLGGLG